MLLSISFQTVLQNFGKSKELVTRYVLYSVKFVNTATAELNSVTSFVIFNCVELHKMVCFLKRKRRNKF